MCDVKKQKKKPNKTKNHNTKSPPSPLVPHLPCSHMHLCDTRLSFAPPLSVLPSLSVVGCLQKLKPLLLGVQSYETNLPAVQLGVEQNVVFPGYFTAQSTV